MGLTCCSQGCEIVIPDHSSTILDLMVFTKQGTKIFCSAMVLMALFGLEVDAAGMPPVSSALYQLTKAFPDSLI